MAVRLRLLAGAAQYGFDAGNDLPRAEGFYNIVIRAEFKADNTVDLLTLGRQHQNGQL